MLIHQFQAYFILLHFNYVFIKSEAAIVRDERTRFCSEKTQVDALCKDAENSHILFLFMDNIYWKFDTEDRKIAFGGKIQDSWKQLPSKLDGAYVMSSRSGVNYVFLKGEQEWLYNGTRVRDERVYHELNFDEDITIAQIRRTDGVKCVAEACNGSTCYHISTRAGGTVLCVFTYQFCEYPVKAANAKCTWYPEVVKGPTGNWVISREPASCQALDMEFDQNGVLSVYLLTSDTLEFWKDAETVYNTSIYTLFACSNVVYIITIVAGVATFVAISGLLVIIAVAILCRRKYKGSVQYTYSETTSSHRLRYPQAVVNKTEEDPNWSQSCLYVYCGKPE